MKRVFAFLLLVLTVFSLCACAGTENNETTAPTEPQLVQGNQVGNICYPFQVEIGTKDGPTGEFVDPTATGKVTVINFWATWCEPCKTELPHFEQFARDNDINLFAIHAVDGKRKMPAYITENYADSPIIFCYDEKSDGAVLDKYFSLLGGTTGYPYTVVLDENGVILYTHTGMMSYDELKAVIDPA